jgi:hypothetical protein
MDNYFRASLMSGVALNRFHNIRNNNAQHIDTQLTRTDHNNTKQNDTQHKDTLKHKDTPSDKSDGQTQTNNCGMKR